MLMRLLATITITLFTSTTSALDKAAGPPDSQTQPPNIVLIMADDVGVETLGCYGGKSYKTPRIDALAKAGMRFNHCYSMPVCHPTRISFLTGRYPFQVGNPRWGSFPEGLESRSLPQLMKRAGYATAVSGKWQLTMLKDHPNHPRDLGFDTYCLFGWHEGPRYYKPLIWQDGKLRKDYEDRFGPEVYTDYLIDFMRKNRERPFFAFYSMALCHDVTDDLDDPVPFGPKGHYDTYTEMIEKMDHYVGRIVDGVEKLGLSENTVILFTADNGTPKSYLHTAESAEPNDRYKRIPVYSEINGKKVQGGKGNLTNDGTNVPLIAYWKGKTTAGAVVDDLVDVSDFLPTCADLAGSEVPAKWNVAGDSFARRLRENKPGKNKYAFAEGRGSKWIRTINWKLYADGRLYNVRNDPTEQKPISKTKSKDKAAQMRMELKSSLSAWTNKNR